MHHFAVFFIVFSLFLHFFCHVKTQDPARPEVAQAMVQCQKAGVRVIVITGDSKETAVAIARDVNIFGRVS
jgi:P-type Ca2+ transporter type 2C